ncbi:unnamed protein product [Rhizophagus irregularis]|uniref:Uncharacterized protein n=1 Tax=Rhizophagus irregularis TaxID=588596 RepID=A0A915Z1I4_9GLOM|nr:unnamed protein product [Rhizophagus irregularis]
MIAFSIINIIITCPSLSLPFDSESINSDLPVNARSGNFTYKNIECCSPNKLDYTYTTKEIACSIIAAVQDLLMDPVKAIPGPDNEGSVKVVLNLIEVMKLPSLCDI